MTNAQIVVFCESTISQEEVRSLLAPTDRPVTVCPPATQGDVISAVLARPTVAVALIDVLYDSQPTVWHEELLWCLQQGIGVYGSSSLGAARAVELQPFGAVAVGAVASYLSGEEVVDESDVVTAVATSAARSALDTGLGPNRTSSVPLVSLRATLADATAAGVLSQPQTNQLIQLISTWFHATRTWERVLVATREIGGAEVSTRLAQWLQEGVRDLAAEDAIALLGRIASDLSAPGGLALLPQFRFVANEHWRAIAPATAAASEGELGVDRRFLHDLADEVRLQGEWIPTLQRALLGVLARRAAPELSDDVAAGWEDQVRAHLGGAGELTAGQLRRLAVEQAAMDRAWTEHMDEAMAGVPGILHLWGRYSDLAARTRALGLACRSAGFQDGAPTASALGLKEADLPGLASSLMAAAAASRVANEASHDSDPEAVLEPVLETDLDSLADLAGFDHPADLRCALLRRRVLSETNKEYL